MIFLILMFLALVFFYLLSDWKSLKHVKGSMRWVTYSVYAAVIGLWLLFYFDTNLVHPVTLLQRMLDPMTAFVNK